VDDTWPAVWRQRRILLELLTSLSDAQWAAPSACPGWTVGDVAAHVISSPQARPTHVLVGLIRAGGDFNRCIRDEAIRAAGEGRKRVLADYEKYDGSRKHPLGTTTDDPLLDIVVHTQDIVRALGITLPMPVAESAHAASYVWGKGFPFRARKRFRGLSLRSTDARWQVGEGPEVVGPVGALLLLLTGRGTSLHELEGPGVEEAARRLAS